MAADDLPDTLGGYGDVTPQPDTRPREHDRPHVGPRAGADPQRPPDPTQVDERALPGPIPVTVRIEWEHTGPQQIDTLALAWTRTLALIRVNDPRHPLNNAWVRAADVRRR